MESEAQRIVEATPQEAASPDTLIRIKTDFATKCFSNAQDLTRMMDQKAGYLLSAVGLLTTAVGIVASRVLDYAPAQSWQLALKAVALASFLAYVLLAFAVVNFAARVYRALPHAGKRTTDAPGLIFPLMLLGRFTADGATTEDLYFRKLNSVGATEILQDYANQIVEVSYIYQHKQKEVNRATGMFQWLTVCWIVTMLLFLATVTLR